MPEGFVFSVGLAMFAATCAGIGEEVITRGALQPVFGILPIALLHGILHAHIAHTPVFIVKVMIWSAVMGIFRRYTNTTTVVIAHAGFNLDRLFCSSLQIHKYPLRSLRPLLARSFPVRARRTCRLAFATTSDYP